MFYNQLRKRALIMMLRNTNIVIDEIEKIKKGRLAIDEEIKQIEESNEPKKAVKYKYNLDRIIDRQEIDTRNRCTHPLFIKEIAHDTEYNCRCMACEAFVEADSMLDYQYGNHLMPDAEDYGNFKYHAFGGPVILYPQGINKDEYYNQTRNNFIKYMTIHNNDKIADHLLIGIFIQEHGYKEDKSIEEARKMLANQENDDITNAIESIKFIKKLQLK
jgi:hypothetical protein